MKTLDYSITLDQDSSLFNLITHSISAPVSLTAADFSAQELVNIDLRDASLCHCSFYKANMATSNLSNVNLRHANFSKACLFNSILCDADLAYANLDHADLYLAKLKGANLAFASLKNATLKNANLVGANLEGADLRNADLRKATFDEAIFQADLRGAAFSFLRNATVVLSDNTAEVFSDKHKYGDLLRTLYANRRKGSLMPVSPTFISL